jgi:hypothetical protein
VIVLFLSIKFLPIGTIFHYHIIKLANYHINYFILWMAVISPVPKSGVRCIKTVHLAVPLFKWKIDIQVAGTLALYA